MKIKDPVRTLSLCGDKLNCSSEEQALSAARMMVASIGAMLTLGVMTPGMGEILTAASDVIHEPTEFRRRVLEMAYHRHRDSIAQAMSQLNN